MLACRRARCENCVRHGLGTARRYIFGYLDLPDSVLQTFEAEEICEDATKFGEPAAICVFVPDVYAAYNRAKRAEATSINAPEYKPYDERKDGVKDTIGVISRARDTNKKAARSDPGGSFFPLVV
jgi:PhnB protein